MAKIKWDEVGTRQFETGVSNGVLYILADKDDAKVEGSEYAAGVAWNGLSNVSESPEGAEVTSIYADNIKYLNLMSAEEFKATIEAYTYPDEFGVCDGSVKVNKLRLSAQKRRLFGITYKTKIGNDLDQEAGYKIHFIYNCLASPSERSYGTINDSPEAITFSWEISTTPQAIETADENGNTYKPTAYVEINSLDFTTETAKAKLKELEGKIYGTADSEPMLPSIDELIKFLAEAK